MSDLWVPFVAGGQLRTSSFIAAIMKHECKINLGKAPLLVSVNKFEKLIETMSQLYPSRCCH